MSEPIELEQEERIKVVRVEDYQALLSVAEELAEGIRRLQDDVVGEYGMSATSDFVVRRTAPLLERFDSFRGVSDD